MNYKFEIKTMNSHDALTIRTNTDITELKTVLATSYNKILRYLGENGEFPYGFPFIIYHNNDMDNLDIEVGFPVNAKFLGDEDIHMSHTPGGHILSCVHVGSYDNIELTYKALTEALHKYDYHPTGSAYEIYLNDPSDTPANDLLTEVGFMLNE